MTTDIRDSAPFFHGRLRGVDHFTIPVRDIDVAQRFYVDLLGAELLMRIDEKFFAALAGDGSLPPERRAELTGPNSPVHLSLRFQEGTRIDLFLSPSWRPALAPHPHWAFGVAPEAMTGLRDALAQSGIPFDGPRRLGPPGQASIYFHDPFGNLLEFATMGFHGDIPVGAPDLSKLPYEWRG